MLPPSIIFRNNDRCTVIFVANRGTLRHNPNILSLFIVLILVVKKFDASFVIFHNIDSFSCTCTPHNKHAIQLRPVKRKNFTAKRVHHTPDLLQTTVEIDSPQCVYVCVEKNIMNAFNEHVNERTVCAVLDIHL